MNPITCHGHRAGHTTSRSDQEVIPYSNCRATPKIADMLLIWLTFDGSMEWAAEGGGGVILYRITGGGFLQLAHQGVLFYRIGSSDGPNRLINRRIEAALA